MLQLNNKTPYIKKQPLTERQMNLQQSKHECSQVTNLRDSRKMETASSSGNTVIPFGKLIIEVNVPAVVVTQHQTKNDREDKAKRSTRSKSPSSISQSTLSTVQEHYTSFKSGDSPLHTSKG